MKPRENLSLNKSAARRIVQHALAGNIAFNAEQKERELKEKILAARKLRSQQPPASDPPEALEVADFSEEGEIEDDEIANDVDSALPLASLATSTNQEESGPHSTKKRKNEYGSDQNENVAADTNPGRKHRGKERKKAKKFQH